MFDTRVVKWPILERRALSLKKQHQLRQWMVDQAIQSAEHLIAGGTPIAVGSDVAYDNSDSSQRRWNPMSRMAWRNPWKPEEILNDASTYSDYQRRKQSGQTTASHSGPPTKNDHDDEL